jgi:3-hydroxybutyryl-CoA dehydratase
MTDTFENLNAGDSIDGPKFAVSRESIRLFCDASLDYNPLHLDDDYMKGNFGKTNFGGIIMHGMNNIVRSKQVTANSRWVLIDVMVRNQNDEKVATGEAMVEFPN